MQAMTVFCYSNEFRAVNCLGHCCPVFCCGNACGTSPPGSRVCKCGTGFVRSQLANGRSLQLTVTVLLVVLENRR